jgi:hypothetical protein
MRIRGPIFFAPLHEPPFYEKLAYLSFTLLKRPDAT